jgi:hypothetical protein
MYSMDPHKLWGFVPLTIRGLYIVKTDDGWMGKLDSPDFDFEMFYGPKTELPTGSWDEFKITTSYRPAFPVVSIARTVCLGTVVYYVASNTSNIVNCAQSMVNTTLAVLAPTFQAVSGHLPQLAVAAAIGATLLHFV